MQHQIDPPDVTEVLGVQATTDFWFKESGGV